MTLDLDHRLAVQQYRDAVEQLRVTALEVGRRVDDAERSVAAAAEFVELRRRRASRAAGRRAAATASGEAAD